MRTLAVDTLPRTTSTPRPAGVEPEMTAQDAVVELRGIRKSFGDQRGAARRRPDRAGRRARRDLRAIRLGQVDRAAHDQPARGAERGLRARARRRVRAGDTGRGAGEAWERARAPASGRHGLPAVQPLPAPDGARQHRAARSAPCRSSVVARPRSGAARGAAAGRPASLGGAVTRRSSRAGSSSASRSRARSASTPR